MRTKPGWNAAVGLTLFVTILLCVIAISIAAQHSDHSQSFNVTCNANSERIHLNTGPLHIRWSAYGGASARVWISTQPSDGAVAPWNTTVVYYALGPGAGLALTLADGPVGAGSYYIACIGVGSSPASSIIGAAS